MKFCTKMIHLGELFIKLLLVSYVADEATTPNFQNTTCPDNFIPYDNICYTLNTTCPYHLPLPFDQYKNVSSYNNPFKLPITKIINYDYYQWTDIQGEYGKLFIENMTGEGDNIIAEYINGTFNYSATYDQYEYICAYDALDNQPDVTYCTLYDEICRDSSCHCLSRTYKHFCELGCDYIEPDSINETTCSVCKESLYKYKEPTIGLMFNYKKGVIYITVNSFLKLLPLTNVYYANSNISTDSSTIYCYTDAENTPHDVTYRYNVNDHFHIYYDSRTYKTLYYEVSPIENATGHYWCKGFKFTGSNVVKVESSWIVASCGDAESFTMNITVDDHNRTYPLTIHENYRDMLTEIIDRNNNTRDIIRNVMFLHLYERDTTTSTTIISYRLYLNGANDMEDVLNKVSNLTELTDYNVTLTPSYCLPDQTQQNNRLTLTWDLTLLGVTTLPRELCLQSDSRPVTRTCMGEYLYGTFWSEVDGYCVENSGELYGSKHTTKLYDLLTSSTRTSIETIDKLRKIVDSQDPLLTIDIHLIVQIFGSLTNSTEISQHVEVASSIMDIDRNTLRDAQQLLNSTDLLLYNLDTLSGNLNVSSTTKTITTKNINIQVSNDINIIGAAFLDGGEVQPIYKTVDYNNLTNVKLAVFSSYRLLEQAHDLDPSAKLVITMFRHDALFNQGWQPANTTGYLGGVYITNFEEPYLSDNITVLIKPDRKYRAMLSCQYWDYGRDKLWYNRNGKWQNESWASEYNDNLYNCKYSQMKFFGIMVGREDGVVLSIVAAVGCGLSILGSMAVILTGLIFQNWRESSGTKILLNFVLTNLMQNIVLSVSSGVDSYVQIEWCVAVGALLHYSVLSQFTWMIFIGYLQYQRYVTVFYSVDNRFILIASVVAWMLPVVPVITVLTVNYELYIQDNYCYLQDRPLYFGVFLPVAFMLTINVLIFGIIIFTIYCRERNVLALRDNMSWLNLRLIILLFFLLGLYWVFGITARFTSLTAFDYFFCISASLQGLILFLYFIVFNKMTRNFWLKQLRRIEMINVMQSWLQQRRRIGRVKLDKSRTKTVKVGITEALRASKRKRGYVKLT